MTTKLQEKDAYAARIDAAYDTIAADAYTAFGVQGIDADADADHATQARNVAHATLDDALDDALDALRAARNAMTSSTTPTPDAVEIAHRVADAADSAVEAAKAALADAEAAARLATEAFYVAVEKTEDLTTPA